MADDKALVSVLMPCCGQLEYTRLSVPRVLRHSRPPFEVLFIDAGSLDGTREYLQGVAAAASMRVEVLHASQESKLSGLVEEALEKARGTFVAWMNNDVLVPEFWLQQLISLVTSHEKIGVVGPAASLAGERQRVAAVPYRLRPPQGGAGASAILLETQEVDRFARKVREENKGQWELVDEIGGFCWLAKREVLQGVRLALGAGRDGLLDAERLSAWARQAGAHLACCRDLYVHHFGNFGVSG